MRRLILLQAATLFAFVGLIWLVLFLLEPRELGIEAGRNGDGFVPWR